MRGGYLHAFDDRRSAAPNTDMKNVSVGALGRSIYQGRVGWGWVSEGWRGGGARVQAVRPAGDGPPKAPRDYV